MSAKTRTLKQTAVIPASPAAVYEALATSKGHRAFTGEPASISPKVGGRVSAYDGWCLAKNLTLVPGKKIVQGWRAADWPEGAQSKVTYILKASKTGTTLSFTQTGIPAAHYEDMKGGWPEHYWVRLQAHFSRPAKGAKKAKKA
jgi:uncharacterized protein YndB with AHSA1/START domain